MTFLVTLVVLCIITGICYLVYKHITKIKTSNEDVWKQVVDKINNSNLYTYQFDKKQEENIQNIEVNVHNVHNNYAELKNNVMAIKSDYLSKEEYKKGLITDKAEVNNLKIGGISINNNAPPGSNGSATGKDWLYLYDGGKAGGGLSMKKLQADTADFKNSSVSGNLVVGGKAEVKDDIVLHGSNKWIMHTPDDGRKSMYFAPGREDSWDWSKQYTFDKDGYITAYGGGLNTRGGSSKYNPDNLGTHFPSAIDNKNHITGDTIIRGDLNLVGGVKMTRNDPGPMVEKHYGSDSNRYGIGQFEDGTMRMYTAGYYGPASVNLSIARDKNTFDDVLQIKNDKSVNVNGSLCLGNICLKNNQGILEACDKALKQCKRVTLS